jgi:hypothetical protein
MPDREGALGSYKPRHVGLNSAVTFWGTICDGTQSLPTRHSFPLHGNFEKCTLLHEAHWPGMDPVCEKSTRIAD